MRSLASLIEAVHLVAARAEFPIDLPIYQKAERDPLQPILFAGNLAAPICVFGRDLGKDEVAVGEPLVGAGGRLVRSGIFQAAFGSTPDKADKRLAATLDHVLLTNTVPFKPPGNKAYVDSVKERFRPYVAELLVVHWSGNRVISLGNEAFAWFARYADSAQTAAIWAREDRYEAELACELSVNCDGKMLRKSITLCPLPHPSPLNARWYGKFPGLLAQRLAAIPS